MALLTAILSDSLPCLICYHDARCYTYTHSAFWSFRLYGKIQMYPLPKRYRQFFLSDTPEPNPWYLSLLVKRASVTRRTNHLFCISLWRPWWMTPLAYLVVWGISPDRLQAFRLRCRARLHDHCRTRWNRTTTSTPVHPRPLRGITCPLAPVSERATTCVESTW